MADQEPVKPDYERLARLKETGGLWALDVYDAMNLLQRALWLEKRVEELEKLCEPSR